MTLKINEEISVIVVGRKLDKIYEAAGVLIPLPSSYSMYGLAKFATKIYEGKHTQPTLKGYEAIEIRGECQENLRILHTLNYYCGVAACKKSATLFAFALLFP